jgi:hypothetical protein
MNDYPVYPEQRGEEDRPSFLTHLYGIPLGPH